MHGRYWIDLFNWVFIALRATRQIMNGRRTKSLSAAVLKKDGIETEVSRYIYRRFLYSPD